VTQGKRALLYADGTQVVQALTDPAAFPTGAAQSIAYAATITPDAALGERVIVGVLTGNLTINAPTNPRTGGMLVFSFAQDATGGRNHHLELGVQESRGRCGSGEPEGGDLVCL
jgi:hypothetical protein